MGDWLALLLLGLAASFMPMVFGLELVLLGSNDGAKKSSSLVGGITLFRVLVAIGVTVLFASGAVAISKGISNIADFLGSTLSQFGQDVTSGQHIILDVLFVVAGILLLRDAYRHIRSSPSEDQPSSDKSSDDESSKQKESKTLETGVAGMIGVGLAMAATNPQQYVFMATGVSQILHMPINVPERLLAFVLFMVASSVMILLPLILVLVSPNRAHEVLGKINRWIHGSMKYIVAGILILIGLYLISKGGSGMVHYFNA
jgi:threonine/homoserine/homoserine lactone efflux protein